MRSHAFTLIEVLIVISIIGILLAIAIPSYQGVLRRGQATAAQSHNHVVRLAVQQWLSLNPALNSDSVNGLDCAPATTLSGTSPSSGYTQGAIGWPDAQPGVTCSIIGTRRFFLVTTTGGGKSFRNGRD